MKRLVAMGGGFSLVIAIAVCGLLVKLQTDSNAERIAAAYENHPDIRANLGEISNVEFEWLSVPIRNLEVYRLEGSAGVGYLRFADASVDDIEDFSAVPVEIKVGDQPYRLLSAFVP